MSQIPNELKYTESHEWLLLQDDGSVTVGITDTAQQLLGDLVFVELPEVGDVLAAGAECAVVESVKAASDVYCPIAGEISAVNETVADGPEVVNEDPYGEGWLFRLKPADGSDLSKLLDADAYASMAEDSH
ncbi:MAG: glycine cleavage system protein GcvH [gamma proteobacterium symbiont of Bathyaustriella thionipta]|nr:glycine cleavage system protein GcvH [gamma proteobacterium symbiont of Bathyaustriella thionipta]